MADESARAACEGAMIAAAIRWLLGIDVGAHWAMVIGAASRLVGPWMNQHVGVGSQASALPDVLFSAVVLMALLGTIQLLRID